jgi:hypothetical protein
LPNENPPPRTFFRKIESLLSVLPLYGAVGIAVFGLAMGRLLEMEDRPWMLLGLCAALLIYGVDRLNLPRRTAACAEWRGVLKAVVALGALGLVGIPLWRRDWLTVAGMIVCLGYSVPVLACVLGNLLGMILIKTMS